MSIVSYNRPRPARPLGYGGGNSSHAHRPLSRRGSPNWNNGGGFNSPPQMIRGPYHPPPGHHQMWPRYSSHPYRGGNPNHHHRPLPHHPQQQNQQSYQSSFCDSNTSTSNGSMPANRGSSSPQYSNMVDGGPVQPPPPPWHYSNSAVPPMHPNHGHQYHQRGGGDLRRSCSNRLDGCSHQHARVQRFRSLDGIVMMNNGNCGGSMWCPMEEEDIDDDKASATLEGCEREGCEDEDELEEDEEVRRMSMLSLASDDDVMDSQAHNNISVNPNEIHQQTSGPSHLSSCKERESNIRKQEQIAPACSASDSLSITSDEGVGDTLLPRIIKPRKRRKKDRKPSNSSTGSEDQVKKDEQHSESTTKVEKHNTAVRTFVTLKPYVPGFYDDVEEMSDVETTVKKEKSVIESLVINDTSSTKTGISKMADTDENCLEEEDEPELEATHEESTTHCHADRVCGCEKCVPSHSFPTPPSSPSSSTSSKHSDSSSSSKIMQISQSEEAFSSPAASSLCSDDEDDVESWEPLSPASSSISADSTKMPASRLSESITLECGDDNCIDGSDRQLVRSYSEPMTESCYYNRGYLPKLSNGGYKGSTYLPFGGKQPHHIQNYGGGYGNNGGRNHHNHQLSYPSHHPHNQPALPPPPPHHNQHGPPPGHHYNNNGNKYHHNNHHYYGRGGGSNRRMLYNGVPGDVGEHGSNVGGSSAWWNEGVKYCVNSLNNTIKRRHSLHSSSSSQKHHQSQHIQQQHQRNNTLVDYSYLHQLAERTQSPAERKWVTLSESTPNRPSCTFSVMCYNVLCSKYATRQMYGYCPPWALDWEYRKKGIMGEIRKYSADIITLQEVETDAFYNFFLPELKSVGYEGIFSPKSRAKHMHEKEKKFVDGCAIFYNESKFTLVKDHLIEFNQLAMANHDGSEDMLNRVMTKDNIGLAALLHVKQTAWNNMNDKSTEKQHVLVCTAHIHWDPEFCDVKLIQTIMLMTEIRKIVAEFSKSLDDPQSGRTNQHRKGGLPHLSENIHLLLCGDLNSLPDSGVIEFLTSGHVSMNHHDFKGHGYKNSLHKLNVITKSHPPANPNLYTHSFRLRPAFDSSIMPYTNYTYDFKGIIDYIFHTSDTMQTLGALGPIDPAWFKENKVVGCPHPHVPSDHFPLLVHLELWPACFSHIQAPNHQQQQSNQLGHHPNMIGGAGGHHTNNMSGAKNNGNMHR